MRSQPDHALSVLVVEDRADVADSTAELLALCGHTLRVARTGAEALGAAARERPDVVLIDLILPDLDGWAVAAKLRSRAGARPVLIAVTGRSADEDRRHSADAGIDLHLVKPVEPKALIALLARIRGGLTASDADGVPA